MELNVNYINDYRRRQIELENYQYHEGSKLKEQVGGDHYSKLAIQPVQYITENNLNLTYKVMLLSMLLSYKDKNGLQDLAKGKTLYRYVNRIGGQKMNFKQKRKIKEWCQHINNYHTYNLLVALLLIVFYGVFAYGSIGTRER